MTRMLGIDTGGTYTDAVLFDDKGGIVATAKALTTRLDLSSGIRASVEQLPESLRQDIRLVSLSTTLATNAVVEGYGSRVCVILVGYDEQDLVRSRIPEILEDSPASLIAGGHNAAGEQTTMLDLEAAKNVINRYKDEVTAFAISSCFSVRNPAHELELLALVNELTDVPVTCGHQLASGLDAPRRALTTALNARLISYIHNLLNAVKQSLHELRIDAPIMMVKGDGSLMNAATATRKPIETILSGPAASVIGACFLSGRRDAIVADIGGTTTDVAIVRNGQVQTSTDGAVIGDWRPMTEAVKVYSIGLGGDSEVRFKPGVGMDIGPRRVMPMSLLTTLHPQTLHALREQQSQSPSPRHNLFALKFQFNDWMLSQLDSSEKQVWDRLDHGPLDMEQLAMEDRALSRAVARMQRRGLLIYSGFTPSDAGHVLSLLDHWCSEGAELAAASWAKQMRHLYGFGQWKKEDVSGPCQSVLEMVSEKISKVLILAGLNQLGVHNNANMKSYSDMLCELLMGKKFGGSGEVFQLGFSQSLPLIGAGAPAHSYFPATAKQLDLELIVPEHAEVTNAVGAVAGRVMQNARVLITQPVQGVFRIHAADGPRSFDSLTEAYHEAEAVASETAMSLALAAGACDPEVTLKREENAVDHDIDGYVFFESTVIASAAGRPDVAVKSV